MAIRYQHLDGMERAMIEVELRAGRNPSSIASVLNRARSTVTREILRNGWQRNPRKGAIAGGYRCVAADRRARVLAGKARCERKLKADSALWKSVLIHLEQGLSPVQIASTLARMDDPIRLSHETIYTALYAMPRGHLRAEVLDLLRRQHKARRSSRANTKKSKSIPDMTLIDQRPSEVEARLIPGHWEGDPVAGSRGTFIATLVERQSRFVILIKLANKRTENVVAALIKAVRKLPVALRRSLTWDRGMELASHAQFTVATDVQVYFCDPSSPWQRGSNENTNGLLRQYYPKGADLSAVTQAQLDTVARKLNTRPRETLHWKTPAYTLDASVSMTH